MSTLFLQNAISKMKVQLGFWSSVLGSFPFKDFSSFCSEIFSCRALLP